MVHVILTPCRKDCAPGRRCGCHRVSNTITSASTAMVTVLLAATFHELAKRSWCASGSTTHVVFNPSSVLITKPLKASGLGSLIWGHMLDTLLFEGYFLSEASFHSRMFPYVMFPSLVVLSYKSTENVSVRASFSASIVSVLTDSSLNDSVIFRYIYTTKIDGVVCPPNISETVAVRTVKLAHRPRIASTTIKFISKPILLSVL